MKRTIKIVLAVLLSFGVAALASACELFPETATILSIEKTATEGLIDTYTITYSDGSTSAFEVTNGADGTDGKDGENAPITAEDLYNEYVERYGAIEYEEFLNIYFAVEETEYSAVHSALLSTVKVYSPFIELDENGAEKLATYTGAAVVYALDEDSVYFLTNYHVVYDKDTTADEKICEDLHCYLYGSEGRPTKNGLTADYGEYGISCEYVGGSITYDLALIKADRSAVEAINPNVKAVALAKTYCVGETAIAIGNPAGYGISVTKGIVSVDSEKVALSGIDGTERTYRSLRMDTSIYGGNSGGGLFNADGELIGLVNAKSTKYDNICFAIPLPIVQAVAENLMDGGAENVYAIDWNMELASQNSRYTYEEATGRGKIVEETLVTSVAEGGLAESLGLQTGDVIAAIAFDGETYSLERYFELNEYRLRLRAETAFTLTYRRGGEEKTVSYTVREEDLKKVD